MAPAELKKKLVKKAGKLPKPMAQLGCSPTDEELKTSEGEKLVLSECWGTNLDRTAQCWVFDLFHENMYEMYKISQWGWDPNSKKMELFSTTSRFIIVSTESHGNIGYVHYRFVLDHDIPSIYCYELQVVTAHQQKGIGSILIQVLVNMSKKAGMAKVLATVFAHNPKSLGFFHKNGFAEDESCPKDDDNLDYLILSKKVE